MRRNSTIKPGTRMTDASLDTESAGADAPKPGGRRGLLLGLVSALAFAGGGFYAAHSGLIDPAGLIGGGGHEAADASGHGGHGSEPALKNVAFVPLEPIMVTLPPTASARHLRFTGTLEVVPGRGEEIAQLMPRIQDVLNTYLRAVDVRDIEQPASSQRLRAQMLRRVQVVVGEGLVRDLLVTEFVLN
jgi:flagellar FliL protein